MMLVTGFYILFLLRLLMFIALISDISASESSLRLVHLMYRHGDRSPLETYPKDPYPEGVWPQGFGQLTKLGMQEQHALGAFVRDYYTGFLNHSYVHDEIKIQSSERARCLMSGEVHLSGMYPPSGDQIWNSEIKWQPIPILARPVLTDNIIAQERPCPRYDELHVGVLKSQLVRKTEKENKVFYEYISENTGIPVVDVMNIWILSESLFSLRRHNITAPSWATESVIKRLDELNAWGFVLKYKLAEMKRLKAGPLLEEITEQMKAKVNGSLDSRMKLFVYSGHDTTLISFLDSLSMWNGVVPGFTATVIVELHAMTTGENEAFYVQIKYRNDTTTEPYLLTIPGCDSKCPFNRFLSLSKDMIPVDWETECQLTDTHSMFTSSLPIAVVVAISVISGIITGILAILTVIWLGKLLRKRQQADYEYVPIISR